MILEFFFIFNCHFSSGTDPLKPLETFVNIEYLTWPIIKYKREVLFGWVDLLVSFGGIAGLFLGFSLLSGVEIIYYFTLRAFCMVFKSRVRIITKYSDNVIAHCHKTTTYLHLFFSTG